jgi:hypothetical protein
MAIMAGISAGERAEYGKANCRTVQHYGVQKSLGRSLVEKANFVL